MHEADQCLLILHNCFLYQIYLCKKIKRNKQTDAIVFTNANVVLFGDREKSRMKKYRTIPV